MFDFIITAIDLPAYHLDMLLVNEPTAINYVIYVAPLDSNYDKVLFSCRFIRPVVFSFFFSATDLGCKLSHEQHTLTSYPSKFVLPCLSSHSAPNIIHILLAFPYFYPLYIILLQIMYNKQGK